MSAKDVFEVLMKSDKNYVAKVILVSASKNILIQLVVLGHFVSLTLINWPFCQLAHSSP
jgi:hypothetical protein